MKIVFINVCDKPSLPSWDPHNSHCMYVSHPQHEYFCPDMSIISYLFLKHYIFLEKRDGVLYLYCLSIGARKIVIVQ